MLVAAPVLLCIIVALRHDRSPSSLLSAAVVLLSAAALAVAFSSGGVRIEVSPRGVERRARVFLGLESVKQWPAPVALHITPARAGDEHASPRSDEEQFDVAFYYGAGILADSQRINRRDAEALMVAVKRIGSPLVTLSIGELHKLSESSLCSSCGYDVVGAPSAVCPECGNAIEPYRMGSLRWMQAVGRDAAAHRGGDH
ncbi:MAG TPA: hypothetical protein VFF65_02470 [Phycisphaerales bacterium]|nr:hypothetical protein [Phycisphaerales bacterium]